MVLLIVYVDWQVLVWNKISPFKGDNYHGSEYHPPEVAKCGGNLGDLDNANICTADPLG